MSSSILNASSVDLNTVDPAAVVCYLNSSGNEYNGKLGARVSSIFVILFVSTFCTMFPVAAKRIRWLRIPLYVYLFARYFGTGVIIATAFVHLLDPAYSEIGPNSCVGMTGNWASYSWPLAIALTAVMLIFLLDLVAERYVEMKYGVRSEESVEDMITSTARDHGLISDNSDSASSPVKDDWSDMSGKKTDDPAIIEKMENLSAFAFRQQIAAFLILEFGVILHSVFVGLNLGVAGDEFATLYPVLVFHQSFEGLGIGARLSAIPFPKRLSWLPWALIISYGLTTPIAIAIGLGVRTTYNGNSFNANIVQGVFDSVSAGILIYNGLVELLARDFLFDPNRTRDNRRLAFMVVCVFTGAGIMALLGKWA